MRRFMCALAFGLSLAGSFTFVHGSDGTTLTITTDTVLAADHVGPVIMAANDVTLDCAGHTITRVDENHAAIEIHAVSGVTVKNCDITGNTRGGDGISLDASSGNTLVDNRLSNHRRAFVLQNAHDNFLSANMTYQIYAGFVLFSSSGNTLNGNYADGTFSGSFVGFQILFSSNNNTLTGNYANGAEGSNSGGFNVYESAGNTLTGNTAVGNPVFGGFSLGRAVGNTVTGNTATGNGTGFGLSEATNNVVTGNTVTRNGVGFRLWSGSIGNTITGNLIAENSVFGISTCAGLMPHNTLMPNRLKGPQRAFEINQYC